MRACIFLLVFAGIATAQTTRTIQAIGSSNMQVTPDQASLDVGVVTSAATAQESAALNDSQTTAVINALKAAGKQFEYRIYTNAPGGHAFNRLDTQFARESRNEIWKFLAKYLQPSNPPK